MFPSVLLSLFIGLDRGVLNCTGGGSGCSLAPRWSETAGRRTQGRLHEGEVRRLSDIHGTTILILYT